MVMEYLICQAMFGNGFHTVLTVMLTQFVAEVGLVAKILFETLIQVGAMQQRRAMAILGFAVYVM